MQSKYKLLLTLNMRTMSLRILICFYIDMIMIFKLLNNKITFQSFQGIIGSDGRHYILDLFRTFPPDANFLGGLKNFLSLILRILIFFYKREIWPVQIAFFLHPQRKSRFPIMQKTTKRANQCFLGHTSTSCVVWDLSLLRGSLRKCQLKNKQKNIQTILFFYNPVFCNISVFIFSVHCLYNKYIVIFFLINL